MADDAHTQYVQYVRDSYPGGEWLASILDDGPWRFAFLDETAPTNNLLNAAALRAYPSRPALAWDGHPLSVPTPGLLHLVPTYAYENLHYFDAGLVLGDTDDWYFDTREEGEEYWTEAMLVLAGQDADAAARDAQLLGNAEDTYTRMRHAVQAMLGTSTSRANEPLEVLSAAAAAIATP